MANTVNIGAFPFNSINNDRTYNADDWVKYFSQFIGNGVFMNPSSSLQVVSSTGMKVTVKKGSCFINGVAGFVTSDTQLDLAVGDGTYPRYDRVMARLNTNTRTISVVVVSGTPGSNPTPPGMVRDGTIYDLVLCNIWVDKGATTITQSKITDTRLHKGVCGKVSGLIDQVDTTTFFDQISSYISGKQSVLESEWNTWVQANKDLANGGNLTAITSELADAREGKTSIKQNLNDNYIKNAQYGIGGSAVEYGASAAYTKSSVYRRGNVLVLNMYHPSNGAKQIGVDLNDRATVYDTRNSKFINILDEKNNMRVSWEGESFYYGTNAVIDLANGLKKVVGVLNIKEFTNGCEYGYGNYVLAPEQQFSKIYEINITSMNQYAKTAYTLKWENSKVTSIDFGYMEGRGQNIFITFSILCS